MGVIETLTPKSAMPLYQVTCSELVYVDRTYEVEAASPDEAWDRLEKSKGAQAECVDEQMQDSYSFEHVKKVVDENGNDVTP